MIQAYYLYCALYFYYYYIVIYKETIIQLTIMSLFSCTRWSYVGVMGESDTRSVLLMSHLLCNLVLVAVTAEKPPSQR